MRWTVPVLWTNDDVAWGTADAHRRQLQFLDNLGIPGVFYVIPRAGENTLDTDTELLRIIEKSRGRGHEYFQHGYCHTPFESGVPETWMLDFSPATRQRYDVERLAIEQTHTLEAMVEKIARGAAIWRKAFGEDSPGYRPGWGAFCGNLYHALEILGYEWVSSRLPCPTSWMCSQGRWDTPINDFREGVPIHPYPIRSRLIEYPIAGDYAFHVPNDPGKIDFMVDVAMKEFEVYQKVRAPMAIVSHYHGLERNGGTGYAVHAKLLPRLLESGQAQFMNMTQCIAAWKEHTEQEAPQAV